MTLTRQIFFISLTDSKGRRVGKRELRLLAIHVRIKISAVQAAVKRFEYIPILFSRGSIMTKKAAKKAGRPPLPSEHKRGHRIQVPVAPPELEAMQTAADNAGQPLAVWMRETLLRAASRISRAQKAD